MEGFASQAWILRIIVENEVREYCVDSSLPLIVSKEWRSIALIYPRGSCTTMKPGNVRLLEVTMEAEELFNKLLRACFKAIEEFSTLRAIRKPMLSTLLRRRPNRVEEELYEIGNVVELCKLVFGEELKPSLEASTRAYIVYVRGSREYERVKSLARIDEGVRGLLESAKSI